VPFFSRSSIHWIGVDMSEVLSLIAIVAVVVIWSRFGCG
jgi:hypothetical protein